MISLPCLKKKISIHAPIVGCDRGNITRLIQERLFQSTHPSWGATLWVTDTIWQVVIFQSTHPSWGATEMCDTVKNGKVISIHAPIVGCDLWVTDTIWQVVIFQSTHPSWGATVSRGGNGNEDNISIHAPIVGCDRRILFY